MEIKALNLNSDNYEKETFEKIKVALDKMETYAVNKDFKKAIAFGTDALERLREEPDVKEIYRILNTAISAVTFESMRSGK